MQKSCDIAIIGAGHAGVEAALSAAKLGADVVLFTISLDGIANMPCNPSIGGTGKGHLVFEIDALGGIMGRAADAVMLSSRMLNASKGPAVQSLRVQADRNKYHNYIKQTLETHPNIRIVQSEISEICFTEDEKKSVCGVITGTGVRYSAKCVVICTGTYLKPTIIAGESVISCGPDNQRGADKLSECLINNNIRLMRFKTGTPARVHADSLDFSKMELQEPDERLRNFSVYTDADRFADFVQIPCYTTYTTEKTHEIIRNNLHRSPMYSGQIKGTGARYCPSIEDKVVRFTDKDKHLLFIEPMGIGTREMYIAGLSTSMPEDVQEEIIHSVPGLENAHIMRYAYAIEYDCCDPSQLRTSLEFRDIDGLFGAGQFNGTSGYEEAAAQGLIAGVNAALKLSGDPLFTLDRSTSYIGMLIDDLVNKGTNEPYRVMTSRTEYRLILRQDNADERLTPLAYKLGLVSKAIYDKLQNKIESINEEILRTHELIITPDEITNTLLKKLGSSEIVTGVRYQELLRRPELNYENTTPLDADRLELPENIFECALIRIKYDGYIKRQTAEVEKHKKLYNYKIPANMDYKSLKGLRLEAIAKLDKYRPANIGEASSISGISPSDITVLLIKLGK